MKNTICLLVMVFTFTLFFEFSLALTCSSKSMSQQWVEGNLPWLKIEGDKIIYYCFDIAKGAGIFVISTRGQYRLKSIDLGKQSSPKCCRYDVKIDHKEEETITTISGRFYVCSPEKDFAKQRPPEIYCVRGLSI